MNLADYTAMIILNTDLIASEHKNEVFSIKTFNQESNTSPAANFIENRNVSKINSKNGILVYDSTIEQNSDISNIKEFITVSNIDNQKCFRVIPDTTTKQSLNLKEIEVIGHRGNGENSKTNRKPLENTLESFQIAQEKGAQMVELDVHFTVDNKLVIFHDSKIMGKWVYKMTFEEFESLYNQYHKVDHLKAPTLQEVFDTFSEDFPIYVEIKYEETIIPNKSHFPYRYHQEINKKDAVINSNTVLENEEYYPDSYIVNLVEAAAQMTIKNPNRKAIYASFSFTVCALLKTRIPNAHVLVLINREISEIMKESTNSFVCDFVDKFDLTGVIFDTKCKSMFEPILNHVKSKNKYLMCYGPGTNNEEEIKNLREFGVTGFCTDDILLCKDVLSKMKNLIK